jgi:hypothetical protein
VFLTEVTSAHSSTVTQALKKSTEPNYSVPIPFWNSCISMTGANRCKLGMSKNRLHGNISCCPTSVDCQWYSCPHGGSTCQYTSTKQKYTHLPQQNNAMGSRKWYNNCIRHLKTCISCWPNSNVNFVLGYAFQSRVAQLTLPLPLLKRHSSCIPSVMIEVTYAGVDQAAGYWGKLVWGSCWTLKEFIFTNPITTLKGKNSWFIAACW